jgi:RHH-type rel operon transcriptional repressor/antitoxin RelB
MGITMDAMLTVRINKDIKEKAVAILQKKGVTVSSLIQTIFNNIVITGNVPTVEAQTNISKEEISRRLSIFQALDLPEPIKLTDDEIRDARLGEKHGFAA